MRFFLFEDELKGYLIGDIIVFVKCLLLMWWMFWEVYNIFELEIGIVVVIVIIVFR